MDILGDLSVERRLYPLLQYNESAYIPEPYVPSQVIIDAHDQPRFGHSNNLDGVIAGIEQQTREYIIGVIVGSLIIAIVAVCWFFAIACLKLAGPKRVGFLAGHFERPCVTPEKAKECCDEVTLKKDQPSNEIVDKNEANEPPPTIDPRAEGDHPLNEKVDQNLRATKRFTRRVMAVRVLFLLSGIAVLVSGGLFYGKGAVSFKNSFEEVQNGIDMVQDVCATTMSLSQNVTKASVDVEEKTIPRQDTGGDPICGVDSEVSTQINSIYNELVANIDQLRSSIDEHLRNIDGDVLYVLSFMEDIEHALYFADIFFYVLVAITVVIVTLIVALLAGVVFAWKGVSNSFTKCIQYALIWPLFIFFLCLSWIFATLFLAAGLAGADFCVNPDNYVEDFLYAHEDKFDGMLFGFMIYYVTGCAIQPPGAKYLTQISSEIAAVLTMAHQLIPLIADLPVESIAQLCNVTVEQATTLKQITTLGHTVIHVLNREFVGLRQIISCETMNPIYSTFVHQAFCDEAVAGMSWIFYTTLFIAIFSMFLIMFRAALYPIKDVALPASMRAEDRIDDVSIAASTAPPFETVSADACESVRDAPEHISAPPDID